MMMPLPCRKVGYSTVCVTMFSNVSEPEPDGPMGSITAVSRNQVRRSVLPSMSIVRATLFHHSFFSLRTYSDSVIARALRSYCMTKDGVTSGMGVAFGENLVSGLQTARSGREQDEDALDRVELHHASGLAVARGRTLDGVVVEPIAIGREEVR